MLSTTTTKDRIIAAAMLITSCKGARHLTIDAVTTETGLSKGGVLYHFPSKTALLEGLVSHTIAQVRLRLDHHLTALTNTPNPTLHATVLLLVDVLEGTLSLPVALLAASAENPDLLVPVREEFRSIWVKIQSETGDVAGAFVIWSALEGLHYMNMFDLAPEGKTQLQQCLAQLTEMITKLSANKGA